MKGLQAVVALCQKDSKFVGFLSDLGEYLKGNFDISDFISVNLLNITDKLLTVFRAGNM